MKRFAITFLALAAVGSGLHAEELHPFTSADGKKTIHASIASVVSAKDGSLVVELRKADGSITRAPAKAFSEADQPHIRGAWIAREAGRKLRPTIEEVAARDKGKPEEVRGRRISKSDAVYSIDLRNNGTETLEDLEVEYVIFWKKAKADEKKRVFKEDQTATGKLSADRVGAANSRKLTTEALTLVADRPNLGGPG